MQVELNGNYQTWNFNGTTRKYADITLSYQTAKELIKSTRYSALTGAGEQRAVLDAHIRKLKREILTGNYTPTQMSAGLQKKHRAKLVLQEESMAFTLQVDSSDPLSQTDGGHRYGAFNSIESELLKLLDKADEKEKTKLETRLRELRELPCGFRIYFDGNPKSDFINLQAGRPVDNSHMFSLKIQQQVTDDPAMKLAFNIAKCLHKDAASPFHELIRFDSRMLDKGSLFKQLPISTLCAKGTSDIGVSLIGLARVGILFGCDQADVLAKFVSTVTAVVNGSPLGQAGKALTTPRNSGSKGSATMLVGVGIALAYRVLSNGRLEATDEDRSQLSECMCRTLDIEIDGNFSGVFKRKILGEFVRDYLNFGDLHDRIPIKLLEVLSASTYNAESLPRKRKNEQESVQAEVTTTPQPIVTKDSLTVQSSIEAASLVAPWDEVQA